VFNLQGSELIIILLLALVVLGPEKLPDAMRKAGQFYAELKKMSTGFQSEFRAAVEEPLRELKETANTIRDSADFTKLQSGEREEKPKSAEMVAPADPDAVPSNDLPFKPAPDEQADAATPVAEPPADVAPGDQEPFASVVLTNKAVKRPPEPSTDDADQPDQPDQPDRPATGQPRAPQASSGAPSSNDQSSDGDVSAAAASSDGGADGPDDESATDVGGGPSE
jgi:sec-independent protein translocase protein TatB